MIVQLLMVWSLPAGLGTLQNTSDDVKHTSDKMGYETKDGAFQAADGQANPRPARQKTAS